MKTTVTINGITQTIKLTKEQMELFEPKEFGRAKENEKYYYVDEYTDSCWTYEKKHVCDDIRYEHGNYFLKEEEAELEAKITSLRRRMIRFSDEHGGDSEWNGKNEHWYIYYSANLNFHKVAWIRDNKEFEKVYFNSIEVAKLALEKFKDELMELV